MEALIRRLVLWKKIALIGTLAALGAAVPMWLYVSSEGNALGTVTNERAGVAPMRAMTRVIQLMQQHRGLSAAALSGGETAAREAKHREVDEALSMLEQHTGDATPQLRRVIGEWTSLAAAVSAKSIPARESNVKHNALVGDLNDVSLAMIDAHELSLDPAIDTYYLIQAALMQQPAVIELVAQLRGMGTGLLAARSMSDADRVALSSLVAGAGTQANTMARYYERAKPDDAALRARIEDVAKRSDAGLRRALAVADQKLLQARTPDLAPADFFRQMTEVIDEQYLAMDQAIGALDDMLGARAAAIRNRVIMVTAALIVFFGAAAFLMGTVARSLSSSAREAVALAEAVAAGDLSCEIHAEGQDEIAALLRAMAQMVQRLRSLVQGVSTGVGAVTSASHEIAQGNQDLSSRTEQQASSLQQTAASMEQMTSTVKHNADTASQASQLASAASEVAERGGSVVSEVVARMGEISASSRKIAEIITVIDGIAFQTNILALNAAVEAARAGEQGRGFAVVAGEVRNLAQRSAQAAREIKSLIADSVAKVESGSTLVNEAGQTMSEIVAQVRRVTDLIGEITSATLEQSSGIGQVNQAVTHLDQMTQQNAALVEQSAAAAQSLKDQADRLAAAVAMFKLSQAEARAVIGAARSSSQGAAAVPRHPVVSPTAAAKSTAPKSVLQKSMRSKPQSPPQRPGDSANGEWKEF